MGLSNLKVQKAPTNRPRKEQTNNGKLFFFFWVAMPHQANTNISAMLLLRPIFSFPGFGRTRQKIKSHTLISQPNCVSGMLRLVDLLILIFPDRSKKHSDCFARWCHQTKQKAWSHCFFNHCEPFYLFSNFVQIEPTIYIILCPGLFM